MSLVINNNLMAANAARNLSSNYSSLATSVRRLSSGLRVGTAADDAAGLAIRELMRADIAAYNQGIRNANDAISLIQTADGALQVIDEKLIRMKELAQQAATGTYNSDQRLMIDSEFQAMAAEIERIANATTFNGVYLINGTLQGEHDGTGLKSTGAMKIHFGTGNSSAEDYYYVNIGAANIDSLFNLNNSNDQYELAIRNVDFSRGITTSAGFIEAQFEIQNAGDIDLIGDIEVSYKVSLPTVTGDGASQEFRISLYPSGRYLINDDFDDFEVYYDYASDSWSIVNGNPFLPNASIVYQPYSGDNIPIFIDLDGSGTPNMVIFYDLPLNGDTSVSFNMYESWGIANNSTQYQDAKIIDLSPSPPPTEGTDLRFGIDIDNSGNIALVGKIYLDGPTAPGSFFTKGTVVLSGSRLGSQETEFSISTQRLAQEMLTKIDDAIIYKDKIRAHIGALQNRLENTVANLMIQAENLQAAESRISDTDVATEMTELVRSQILTQASVAMLAQANSLPQMGLQLIGG